MSTLAADVIPLSEFTAVKIPGGPTAKISIKKFVESKKLKFAPGLGFYQLSKPELIQLNKRILVQRISQPAKLITGNSVKDILGITDASRKFMVSEDVLKEFRIYVQSTSYNRNLMGKTTFLYVKDGVAGPWSSQASVSVPEAPAAVKRGRGRSGRAASTRATPAKRTRKEPVPASASASVVTNPSTVAATPPTPAPTPKGAPQPIEIVFSFDTTGSMYPCLSSVRTLLRATFERLTHEIPSIKIGLLAHGDYCDENSTYIIQTANDYKFCTKSETSKLVQFASSVEQTCGGDWEECYELVLHEVGTKFNWSPGANKSLVLIGDAPPHPSYQNPGKLDWKAEARMLKDKGIRVYAVQALDNSDAEPFYRELAQLTMGFHLKLHQFSSIIDFLTAVCYHEGDFALGDTSNSQLTNFESEVNSAGRMVRNLRDLFDQLHGRPSTVTTTSASGLIPVSPSRFQVLHVDVDQPIKEFALSRGLIFKTGRGFYEFTKAETISDKKEVILMDKTTGDFYTGWEAARELAGIEPGLTTKQSPKTDERYIAFVQSTSYNRKLIGGQRFLYEVDSDH